MIYVDSNVFIYAVVADEKTEKKTLLSKKILLKIAQGSLKAATSSLTWDEFVWVIRRIFGSEVAIIEGKKFLRFPNLKILSVDEKVIREAQKIVEKYRIKPRDAIHVACALKNGIKKVISDDPDLDRVEEIERIKLTEIR